jgi:nucleoside 2-deoxyribosyltransferase
MDRTSARVYFARAIDGQDPSLNLALAARVREELHQAGLTFVDPTDGEPRASDRPGGSTADLYRALVEHDLAILRTCDAILMDMTLPHRNYIGCVCEMTYAHLWQIPCVVYLGSQETSRPWLHYHATAIHQVRADAIDDLKHILLGKSAEDGGK